MHSYIETSKLIKLKKRQQRFNAKSEVTLLPSPEFVKLFLRQSLPAYISSQILIVYTTGLIHK
jgi:hypothetical protein